MIDVIKKIFSLLDRNERKQFLWLVLAVFVVAIIEVIGIASVMPFMAVVTNPEVVQTNRYLSWAYDFLGLDSVNSFLILLGVLVFIVIVLSNVFKSLALFLQLRFFHFRLYKLSQRLLFKYLSQPYIFFLNQNTAVLGRNILSEVNQFAHNVLQPCTQILSKAVLILFIAALLFFVDPLLAFTIVLTLGGAYVLIYVIVQRKLARLGEERYESNAQRYKAASEAFGGVKELKVLNREKYFFDHFSRHAYKMEVNNIKSGIIRTLPIHIMEVLAFGGIVIIALYFLMLRQSIGHALPVMALYAFAGYRLMPALQAIFTSVSQLRFNMAVLDGLHRDLSDFMNVPVTWQKEKIPVLPFQGKIKLTSVTFAYPGTEVPVIRDLNLTINKNANIGLVGATGAGKTTLVDILLGLIMPRQGSIYIDNQLLSQNNLPAWQNNIGYVPQSIFLSDDSLACNIALGVPPEDIDMASVERAAKLASLHEFVINELPTGYSTIIGERGIRLSGGQRQRIGIARALYHDPDVLIMDEATSALDGITEEAVIQAIRHLSGQKTIITIAHRLTTLKDCDLIYVMDKGQVIDCGSYDELFVSSSQFRNMASMGKSG